MGGSNYNGAGTSTDKSNVSFTGTYQDVTLLENGILRIIGNETYCANGMGIVKCIPEAGMQTNLA